MVEEPQNVWAKTRVPIRRLDYAVEQLKELVQQWDKFKIKKSRRTATQKSNEKALVAEFNPRNR